MISRSYSTMLLKISLCLLLFSQKNIVSGQYSYSEILPSGYNRNIAPIIDGKPVDVNVSMVILSLKPDLNAQMSFSADFFYQLYWYDRRLNISSDKITLDPHWKDKLWIPDTYFRNSISGGIPKLYYENFYFRITKDKHVFMATRMQMKLNCDMDFTKFPFDRQTCFINITTLSQTMDMVTLYWEEFRLGSRVDLPEYEIIDGEYSTCKKSFGKIGEYSCLYVVFHLKREIGKYLIKRFIPSALIVIMTFIGFWIPTQVTPARVSLIITSLLALIAQQIQGELQISYVYALEVYTVICIVFVFATLIEYAIAVSWPHKTNIQIATENQNKKRKGWALFTAPDSRNCRIDILSRTIFPSAFGLTILIYSLYYYFS